MDKILIEVSAKHIHLSKEDKDILFGKDYPLHPLRELTQKGQFVSEETLEIQLDNKKISDIRVVFPDRNQTKIELSLTDIVHLGVRQGLNIGEPIKGTEEAILLGPMGKLRLLKGLIVYQRHIHISPEKAKELNLTEKSIVAVKFEGKRELVFHNIKIRIEKGAVFSLHIDTDEGNAAGITRTGEGILLRHNENNI